MACLMPTLFQYVTLAAGPLGVDLCALVGHFGPWFGLLGSLPLAAEVWLGILGQDNY